MIVIRIMASAADFKNEIESLIASFNNLVCGKPYISKDMIMEF